MTRAREWEDAEEEGQRGRVPAMVTDDQARKGEVCWGIPADAVIMWGAAQCCGAELRAPWVRPGVWSVAYHEDVCRGKGCGVVCGFESGHMEVEPGRGLQARVHGDRGEAAGKQEQGSGDGGAKREYFYVAWHVAIGVANRGGSAA